jgi:hypothetical protein
VIFGKAVEVVGLGKNAVETDFGMVAVVLREIVGMSVVERDLGTVAVADQAIFE